MRRDLDFGGICAASVLGFSLGWMVWMLLVPLIPSVQEPRRGDR